MRRAVKFIIPLPPVTKKNSQRIVRCGRYLKIVPSAQYTRYERDAGRFLRPPTQPITEPVEVKCLFYMPTRRKVDLTNLLEAADDALVKHGVLADDNARIIVSHDGSRVLYDKANPRTEISIREAMRNEEVEHL